MTSEATAPIPSSWGRFAFLDLVNSTWTDHVGGPTVFDRLPQTQWQQAFLGHWGLRAAASAGSMPRAEMIRLRRALRKLLERIAAGERLSSQDIAWICRQLLRAPAVDVLSERGGFYVADTQPRKRDWAWVQGQIVRSFVEALVRNNPPRLKICQNPNCSWAFYDESRGRNRRWCDRSVCGNLVKVRSFRTRARNRV